MKSCKNYKKKTNWRVLGVEIRFGQNDRFLIPLCCITKDIALDFSSRFRERSVYVVVASQRVLCNIYIVVFSLFPFRLQGVGKDILIDKFWLVLSACATWSRKLSGCVTAALVHCLFFLKFSACSKISTYTSSLSTGG